MRNLVFTAISIIVLFIISCSDDIIQVDNSTEQGKILLKIDNQNVPQNVVSVKATLTRDNYESITGVFTINSDSNAELLLSNIASGDWHLKVDAEDSSSVIIYSGETDVAVLANYTNQVYLTLKRTGDGVGAIYIYVTWDNSSSWIDYFNNPIFIPSGTYWDYKRVQQPKILYDGNIYRMYYTAQGASYSGYVGLAVSNDGINWTNYSENPVLSPSDSSWDAYAVSGATVIKDESGYKMYYSGWSDHYSEEAWNIGLATSEDGIHWEKYPNPVLTGSEDWEYQLAATCVIKIDEVYYMYYMGRNLPNLKIGLATSVDGVNWTKHLQNPILSPDVEWEGTGIYYANVHKEDDQYIMYYMNGAGTGFGKATSTDGVNWTKDSQNPFFTKNDTYNYWSDYKIAYPYYLKINNQDRIYYSGFSNYYPDRIGFMYK